MVWLDNYKTAYNLILAHIKSKGIKVFHREIKGGAGGHYNWNKVIITIDKQCKGTLEGCYLLCHELIHWEQNRYDRFPGFFEMDTEFSEEKLKIVIDAEMDAVKGACKMLKTWGINYESSELTAGGYEESVKFWKKYYFPDK